MNVKEMKWEGIDWIHMAQDRGESRLVVRMVMKLGGFYKVQGITSVFSQGLHCMKLSFESADCVLLIAILRFHALCLR
jgi:hypothetical protein